MVLIQGPRTVGKSTLLRVLARRHGRRVIDLDDPGVRAAAADDPGLFATGPAPVFVDEYQHVPEVLDSIKAELNRDGSPGRFVLAGSTRFEALPLAAQSLTGASAPLGHPPAVTRRDTLTPRESAGSDVQRSGGAGGLHTVGHHTIGVHPVYHRRRVPAGAGTLRSCA